MSASQERYVGVLDAVGIALSETVAKRAGGLGDDPLLVVEFVEGQTRVLIGKRSKMVPALVADGILDATSQTFLAHTAPVGFVWVVVNWGEEVSTILHPHDAPARPDRRAS